MTDLSWKTFSCPCDAIFKVPVQEDGEGAKACPVCGRQNFSGKQFEELAETQEVKEQQEELRKLKSHLRKALYRSRKL